MTRERLKNCLCGTVRPEIEKGVTKSRVFVIISANANVAQWQSSGFVNRGLSVRIRPLAVLHFVPAEDINP